MAINSEKEYSGHELQLQQFLWNHHTSNKYTNTADQLG